MGSGTVPATPSDDRGGRAFKPGPRWAFLAATLVALAVAGVLVLVLAPSGTTNVKTYGHLPTGVPRITITAPCGSGNGTNRSTSTPDPEINSI